MKTFAFSPLAVVLLATGVLAQQPQLSRLPSVETRLEQHDKLLASLQAENAELRELLENEICGCDVCDCACIAVASTTISASISTFLALNVSVPKTASLPFFRYTRDTRPRR